jgi:hypothetical protein
MPGRISGHQPPLCPALQGLDYRHFATAAEAIRFVVEDFPSIRTLGAWMQVGDERFDSEEIHRLS